MSVLVAVAILWCVDAYTVAQTCMVLSLIRKSDNWPARFSRMMRSNLLFRRWLILVLAGSVAGGGYSAHERNYEIILPVSGVLLIVYAFVLFRQISLNAHVKLGR